MNKETINAIKSEYDKYYNLCRNRLKFIMKNKLKFSNTLIITTKKANPTEEDLFEIKMNFLNLYN
jgi:hypothetical protein